MQKSHEGDLISQKLCLEVLPFCSLRATKSKAQNSQKKKTNLNYLTMHMQEPFAAMQPP